MRAGGITPITKPMLGMKLVTKASTAHTNAPGTPIINRATPSRIATTNPNPAATAI